MSKRVFHYFTILLILLFTWVDLIIADKSKDKPILGLEEFSRGIRT